VKRKSAKAPPPFYSRVRDILETARATVARSVNTTQVVANWLIGREIVEEEQRGKKRADYGEMLLEELAQRLGKDFGAGFSLQNLRYMRQFYLTYTSLFDGGEIRHALRGESVDVIGRLSATPPPELAPKAKTVQIRHAARGESWQPGRLHPNLSWTHYRTLLRLESADARSFYEIEAIESHWTARELERQINSLLYERLARSKDKRGLMRLAKKGQEIAQPADVFKDPLVIEFLGLPESPRLVESDLETALIDNLQSFLLELGKGFAFVARQQRITIDGDHFYIDLVFYHTVLKCYVLIDVKVGKLTHTDLGQLQLYVNYYDEHRLTTGDHPTLGLILCSDKNDAVVKYTLGREQSKRIFASRYQLYLPTEEELRAEIQREVKRLPGAHRGRRTRKTRKGAHTP
jgi:predicted nuclease of restriction endonuclease-like (RecB) superfamily